jgi:hypothetical protein
MEVSTVVSWCVNSYAVSAVGVCMRASFQNIIIRVIVVLDNDGEEQGGDLMHVIVWYCGAWQRRRGARRK